MVRGKAVTVSNKRKRGNEARCMYAFNVVVPKKIKEHEAM
jgi:hypothetical protein